MRPKRLKTGLCLTTAACGQVAEFIVKVVHPYVEGRTADGPHAAG